MMFDRDMAGLLTRLNAGGVDENRPSPEVARAKQRFGIIGNTPALNEAVARALVVAPIDLSVLVIGESGSGKEFFPKIIHENSARKHARYIAINCGAIPEGTIDSELFGHEKGSFTGAVAARKGYFEEADGGTIFLDEVAELPLTTQARLLRVLETGEFLKVGSSQVQRTNVRIVAATNVNLPAAIAQGKFREDLFYRLSTVQIDVPPLRDRTADIMLMARRFASTFAETYRTAPVEFDDSARMVLQDYSWPGNVRQLKNIVEQIALFNAGNTVTGDIVDGYLPRGTQSATPVRAGSHSYADEREALFNMIFNLRARIDELEERLQGRPVQQPLTSTVDVTDYPTALVPSSVTDQARHIFSPGFATAGGAQPATERERIADALIRHDGHRKAAAADLGISERTLYRKIREYDLE